MMNKLTREDAWKILMEYNQSPSLLNHTLTVEAVMEHFAELNGEDPEVWGVVGLLHDLDYEKYPDEHCHKTEKILREKGVDDAYIRAAISHGYGICNDVKPESKMEKVLYAIDELTGLIYANCLMRPSKSVLDLKVKSVKKKFKDKKFAAGVNRDIILKGCEMLEMDLDEVIAETIEGMKKKADEIGLRGNL